MHNPLKHDPFNLKRQIMRPLRQFLHAVRNEAPIPKYSTHCFREENQQTDGRLSVRATFAQADLLSKDKYQISLYTLAVVRPSADSEWVGSETRHIVERPSGLPREFTKAEALEHLDELEKQWANGNAKWIKTDIPFSLFNMAKERGVTLGEPGIRHKADLHGQVWEKRQRFIQSDEALREGVAMALRHTFYRNFMKIEPVHVESAKVAPSPEK